MFAIAPYLVEVKDERKQPQDLWDFYAHENLHSVLRDYYKGGLGNYERAPKNPKRMFMVSKLYRGTDTSVSGVYQTGAFGFESQIYSTSQKKIAHNRKSDEADMLPFNFSFYLPRNTSPGQRKRGLMLLGRFNTLGIRHLTIPHLQVYFRDRFPGFTLGVERVVPRVVMETLLNQGTLRTIRLIKKSIPKDIASIFTESDQDKIGDVELVIHAKRRSPFSDINWLLEAVGNRTSATQIVTLPSFKQDNVKLEILVDGRVRTVDIGNPGKLSSNIEIADVSPDVNGHPRAKEWLHEADKLAEGIVKSWGVKSAVWESKL